MSMLRKKETEAPLELYTGYKHITKDDLHLRPITDAEYEAVSGKFKSNLRLSLTAPGFVFLGGVLWAIGGLKYSISSILQHDPEGWLKLFVLVMVDMFILSLSAAAMLAKKDKFISDDSLVTSGEVIGLTLLKGNRGSVVGGRHVIALHGSKELITIEEDTPIEAGNIVLMVKSKSMNVHIFRIPEDATDLYYNVSDYSYEINSNNKLPVDDYSEYKKIPVQYADKHLVTELEYEEIPLKYRSVRPLGYGSTSAVWVIMTIISVILAVALYLNRHNRIEVFLSILIVFILDMLIELFLTKVVLTKKIKSQNTFCTECVPISKGKASGHCFISAIIPEKKLYIERIEIAPDQFDHIPVNEPVKLYYCPYLILPTVYYVKRVSDWN